MEVAAFPLFFVVQFSLRIGCAHVLGREQFVNSTCQVIPRTDAVERSRRRFSDAIKIALKWARSLLVSLATSSSPKMHSLQSAASFPNSISENPCVNQATLNPTAIMPNVCGVPWRGEREGTKTHSVGSPGANREKRDVTGGGQDSGQDRRRTLNRPGSFAT